MEIADLNQELIKCLENEVLMETLKEKILNEQSKEFPLKTIIEIFVENVFEEGQVRKKSSCLLNIETPTFYLCFDALLLYVKQDSRCGDIRSKITALKTK